MTTGKHRWWWAGITAIASVLTFALAWGITSVASGRLAPSTSDDDSTSNTSLVVEPVSEPVFDPPTLDGPPRGSGEWVWFELRGGECLAEPPSSTEPLVVVVDCETPHRARYVAPEMIDPLESSPYPGDTALEAASIEHCRGVTADAAGIGEEVSDAVVTGFYLPDNMSWKAGHRVIACVVSLAGGGVFPDPDLLPRSD